MGDLGFHAKDAQRLFHSLDSEGRGQIFPADLYYLDEWELTEILDPEDDHEFSDTDSDNDSDEEATVSEATEEVEEVVTKPVEREGPQQSFRSLLPWPRISTAPAPAPRGPSSKLLV